VGDDSGAASVSGSGGSVDADSFESFVRFRSAALLRAAYLLTGDQHLAEDLVQSALARTYRYWSRLHDDGNADAYTRKVMYRLQVSHWRRPRFGESAVACVPEPRVPTVSDEADAVAVRLTLRRALQRLGQRQRAVLVLRFFEDQTEAQTAEVLGIAVGTVKSQTAKAVARLRLIAPELQALYSKEGAR
jgi:RNA polymerase sigma-70 factor (sigma-E family)